jgi:hypothetical protein
MRTAIVSIVLVGLVLSLVAACAPPQEGGNLTNTSDYNVVIQTGEAAAGNATIKVNTTPPRETPDYVQPEPVANTTAPVPPSTEPETPTETEPATDLGSCPLLTVENMVNVCKPQDNVTVSLKDGHCNFQVGASDSLNVSSVPGTQKDLDAWIAAVPTADYAVNTVTARAEVHRVQFFVWFTGKRLVTVVSNSIAACRGDNLMALQDVMKMDAAMPGEKDQVTMLRAGIHSDSGKKTLTNVQVAQMLGMTFSKSGALAGQIGVQNASGTFKANWKDNTYSAMVRLTTVPKLEKGEELHAYLVSKPTWDAIDIGALQFTSDGSLATYQSSTNLLDHPYVILTLNPVGAARPGTIVMEGFLA